MSNLAVTDPVARSTAGSFRLRLIAAFFAIYILWGTTFLAIRIAVQELPPLFAAGVRFLIAGVVLYGFMLVKGQASPTRTQWRNLACMAVLMFVVVYGMLFWAEKYVPSGIASVLEATIPILTLILEMLIFRQQRFRWSIAVSTLLGFGGVGILLLRGNGQTYGLAPCVAVLVGSLSWSLGSVLSRSMDLPKSRPVTAGAAMMLGGAVLLALAAAFGEMRPFPPCLALSQFVKSLHRVEARRTVESPQEAPTAWLDVHWRTTKSPRPLAPAAWAKCFARPMRNWAAKSR